MNASAQGESQTVTVRHWEAQDMLHSTFSYSSPRNIYIGLFPGVASSITPRNTFLALINALVPGTTMITIIRKLAYRAGIIKMENEVFDAAWSSLVCSIVALLRPARIMLTVPLRNANMLTVHRRKANKKRIICVDKGETMYTVPPNTSFSFCNPCGKVHSAFHTPVPGQIETAARSVSIPFKVYGDVWHCMPNSMEENERAEAESEYAFLDPDDEMAEG